MATADSVTCSLRSTNLSANVAMKPRIFLYSPRVMMGRLNADSSSTMKQTWSMAQGCGEIGSACVKVSVKRRRRNDLKGMAMDEALSHGGDAVAMLCTGIKRNLCG